jgi:hypothetical protein
MAAGDFSEKPDLEIDSDGRWTVYTGSRDELIGLGIFKDEHFPVLPKRVKYTLGPDGCWKGSIWIRRRAKGRFEAEHCHDGYSKKSERSEEFKNPESWRKDCEMFSEVILHSLLRNASGEMEQKHFGEVTIRFDDTSLAAIRFAIHQVESAIRNGNVVYVGQAAAVQKKLPAAKADKCLQQFILRMQTSAQR